MNNLLLEENRPKFELTLIHRWILPLLIETISYKYELKLQKIKYGKITRQYYISCKGASLMGFLYSKYVIYYLEKYYIKHKKDKEERIKKKKSKKKKNLN